MNDLRVMVVLSILLVVSVASAEEQMGEPEVVPGEVVAPEAAWDDPDPWGGNPPPWFEDPSTVDCGGRDACEAALMNMTAGGS